MFEHIDVSAFHARLSACFPRLIALMLPLAPRDPPCKPASYGRAGNSTEGGCEQHIHPGSIEPAPSYPRSIMQSSGVNRTPVFLRLHEAVA